MTSEALFTQTEPHLLATLAELIAFEPIFHTREFAATPADLDRRMASTYWEVGASGLRYTRDFILQLLSESPPVEASAARWQTYGHALQQLGPSAYLLTYTLNQNPRITRRATIWQATLHGWQILYHQGTLVAADEPDLAPTPDSPAP